MLIDIFSDSHGRNAGMFYCMERDHPQTVIHLGDYTEDAEELRRSYPSVTVYSVRGNNDYDPERPWSAVVAPDGVPLYLTHGHKEHVSMHSFGHVPVRAQEAQAKVALFGHTHRVLLEKQNDIWILNPGSISLPRGGAPSYAQLQVENGKIRMLRICDEDGHPILVCNPENEKETGGKSYVTGN